MRPEAKLAITSWILMPITLRSLLISAIEFPIVVILALTIFIPNFTPEESQICAGFWGKIGGIGLLWLALSIIFLPFRSDIFASTCSIKISFILFLTGLYLSDDAKPKTIDPIEQLSATEQLTISPIEKETVFRISYLKSPNDYIAQDIISKPFFVTGPEASQKMQNLWNNIKSTNPNATLVAEQTGIYCYGEFFFVTPQ